MNERGIKQLNYGMDQCFVDKNKCVKRNLANNFENVADQVTLHIDDSSILFAI